ncbi:MAG TPA: hypothetical protein IGS53_21670 [Leptolyngbyaceae cyanobacterium M33_DOE_097]|nr:hypothetical protein [Leptolyngbyaceae cyanobacterium M33_DOE_097]
MQNGIQSRNALTVGCINQRAHLSKQLRPPVRAKAVGDLATTYYSRMDSSTQMVRLPLF